MSTGKEKERIIISALQDITGPIATFDLFNRLEPSEQGMFNGGVRNFSKELDYFRKKEIIKKCDVISANIHGKGKGQVTWMLNRDKVQDKINIDAARREAVLYVLSQQKEPMLSGDLYDALSDTDRKQLFQGQQSTLVCYLQNSPFVKNGNSIYESGRARLTWIMSDDAGYTPAPIKEVMNTIQEAPIEDNDIIPVSDPDIENLVTDFVKNLNILNQKQQTKPIVIERKDEKITALKKLCTLLSDDISELLLDIVADIERVNQ